MKGRANNVLLVAGSPEPSTPGLVARLASEHDLTIAVDRGANSCQMAGVVPQLFCGDADTVAPEVLAWVRELGVACDLHAPKKDETDLELALRLAQEHGAGQVTVTCASGGSPDHQLAVFGVLARHARVCPRIVEDAYECRVLAPGGRSGWELGPEQVGKTFSVVPLSPGTCVSLAGLRWELDHACVDVLSDLGVSNVVEEAGAQVTCHSGVAAAFVR